MKGNYLKAEESLTRQGFSVVAGLDEAGRGSLVGPVVVSAVIVFDLSYLRGIDFNDSKKSSEKKREELYEIFTSLPSMIWSTASVSAQVIDRTDILRATKLAMRRAVAKLDSADALIIDGNFKINSKLKEISVIKGDERVISCKIAGIIAKVTRDRVMRRLDKTYPEYGFVRNKGYGTKEHFRAIKRYGLSPIHRKSFKSL